MLSGDANLFVYVMAALYISEISDPALLALPIYAIGDKVRVKQITLTKNDAKDTKTAFLAALGRVLKIRDIELWETGTPENPYHITYSFNVGHLTDKRKRKRKACFESIYLTADEIERVVEI